MSEYSKWLKKAYGHGWKVPVNESIPEESWINYWKACEAYAKDPSVGRPVIPHRSGGAR